MATEWIDVTGEIARGHRVASGTSGDPRFPGGTIAAQLPFFRRLVPGFDDHLGVVFAGTLNLRLAGRTVAIGTPEISVRDVRWAGHFPPETFHLSRCAVVPHGRRAVPAFLYMPDPATKPDHFQEQSVVELLAPFIPGLAYGDAVGLRYRRGALTIAAAG